jgi:hypothetical protein
MAIYRSYQELLVQKLPTLYRKFRKNALRLLYETTGEGLDVVAGALSEFGEVSWPLATASGWVLDQHWGPYLNLKRGGLSDPAYRIYLQAKVLLNSSWGSADQALVIFSRLLPGADLQFDYFPPKAWTITITGVDMATAAPAVAFMTKRPSPEGGGFSVAGDNGMAIIVDPQVLSYGSVYGAVGIDYQVTGWYGSVYGAGGGAQAGHAHVAAI